MREISWRPHLLSNTDMCYIYHGVELRKLSPNGMITNDKFCLSRHARLHLSHWRLAQRSQPNVAARLSYPSDRDESTLRHRGGSNEATPMDMPPSASGADGSSAPLGSSLSVPSAMDHSSSRGVNQTGGIT